MVAQEDPHLVELKARFSGLIAEARGEGHDLADFVTCIGAVLAEVCAALPPARFSEVRASLSNFAMRQHISVHARLQAASEVVYRSGEARRRRTRR